MCPLPFRQLRKQRGYQAMKPCAHCGQPTDNPRFCSRRCAAIMTNSEKPKRPRTGRCRQCSKPIRSRHVYCSTCRTAKRANVTLQDLLDRKGHPAGAASAVRQRARAVIARCGRGGQCERCSYALHAEVCHIKAISSFPLHAKVSTINAPDNLLVLCPNCHWEFDHGVFAAAEL